MKSSFASSSPPGSRCSRPRRPKAAAQLAITAIPASPTSAAPGDTVIYTLTIANQRRFQPAAKPFRSLAVVPRCDA